MQHKLTLPQLKKYDITQKVIDALADANQEQSYLQPLKRVKLRMT